MIKKCNSMHFFTLLDNKIFVFFKIIFVNVKNLKCEKDLFLAGVEGFEPSHVRFRV